jgi:hypothetical protein
MNTIYLEWFKREIQVWKKNGEELVTEIPLPEIDLSVYNNIMVLMKMTRS